MTARTIPDDFAGRIKALRSGALDLDDLPDAFVEMLCDMRKQTRAALRAELILAARREAAAPTVGMPAPDFTLEVLAPNGARTGETLQLSEVRGRPVALVFGSYT